MSKEPHIDVLDDSHTLTVEELCERCQVEITWIEEMVAQGVISPVEGDRQFAEVTISTVRTARRLERDFALNAPGVALALELLAEIDRLKSELRRRR
jgi:chaperone modulatory protein CbpM